MKNARLKILYIVVPVLLVLVLLCFEAAKTSVIVRAEGEGPTSEAGTGTPAPGPITTPSVTPTEGAKADGVVATYVLYETEEIEIDSTKKVYYCVIKGPEVKGVKPTELIPASKNGTYEMYYIDFSVISSAKDSYIGIATSLTPGADGLVPVQCITLLGNEKKVEVFPDYCAAGFNAEGYGVISKVVLTMNDGKVITYDHSGTNGAEIRKIQTLDLQFKKGANGQWKSISELKNVTWETMKSSGATVYFRINAENQNIQKTGRRYSKEVKIKLAVSKAPAGKIDSSKLTINFKNGMQFRLSGGLDTSWKTVLPFDALSKTEDPIRDVNIAKLYEAGKENTSTKTNEITLADCYKALGVVEPTGTEIIEVDYRMAPTEKKAASRSGTIALMAQMDAPVVVLTADAKGVKFESILSHADDKTLNPTYEYMILLADDLSAKKVRPESCKWSAAKLGAVLKPATKGSYVLIDGSKKDVLLSDSGVVMLVRRKGVNASSKAATVLASKYLQLDIPDMKLSPTPVPSTTPSATPTPTTAASVNPGA